jgi:ubiquinone/menaquinone biosynthesis C-methylase UbiE
MSALPRTLEPEVMDSEEEARDYDAMDHAEVNARFCEDLLAVHPRPRRTLDVGTGTALIAIELCRRTPEATVEAIDLARPMIARATRNVERAGLGKRIRVTLADAKALGPSAGPFDAVLSNSLVHHIAEPFAVLGAMWRVVSAGGVLFVRDLARPEDTARVTRLAELYAAAPPVDPASPAAAMHARQRALFVASLHAALTVAEVRAGVAPLGIPESAVHMTSDRHWTLACVRS